MIIQAISLLGAALILLAFSLQQWGRWSATDARYLWSNLVGSVILSVVAWIGAQWGFLLMESVWAAVSLRALMRRRISV